MSPLIARAESILGQLAAIREAATKGEWFVDESYIRHRVDAYTSPAVANMRGLSLGNSAADARAIVARINGWQADEDPVRGMLENGCEVAMEAGQNCDLASKYQCWICRSLNRWCERWEEVLKGVA